MKTMKNKVKGAIVGGLSALLLIGGAGTFALWQDSVTVAGATATISEGLNTVLPTQWTYTVLPVGRCPQANPLTHAQLEACTLRPGTTVTADWTGTVESDVPAQWMHNAGAFANPAGWTGGVLAAMTWTAVPANDTITMSRTWTITEDVNPGSTFVIPTVTVDVRVTP